MVFKHRFLLGVVTTFFAVGGFFHFYALSFFMQAMPEYLGYHRELVLLSGLCELLGAAGLLMPRTRVFAAYGLIALCIVVFPANLNMALHPDQFPVIPFVLLYLRLPLQLVIIWMIYLVKTIR
jgi:uncharacterized membrane protein